MISSCQIQRDECRGWSWIKLPRQLFPGGLCPPGPYPPPLLHHITQFQRLPPLPHSVKLHSPPFPSGQQHLPLRRVQFTTTGGRTIVANTRLLLKLSKLGQCTTTVRWAQIRLLRLFPGGMFTHEFTLPSPWPGENSPNIHPSISFQTYGHTCPAAGASALM